MLTSIDEKLSDSVSLSKIFDCLVADGEGPLVLLNFLDGHRDVAEDILTLSDYLPRILSFDFLDKCSIPQISILADISVGMVLKQDTHVDDVYFFINQVLTRKHASSIIARNIFKEKMREAGVSESATPHGAARQSRQCKQFDDMVMECSSAAEIADAVNSWTATSLPYMLKLGSLVLYRLIQDDVFLLLSPLHQFVILNILKDISSSDEYYTWGRRSFPYPYLLIIRGLKILLRSPVDMKMKKMIWEILKSFPDNELMPEINSLLGAANMLDMFEDNATFGNLVVKMLIKGETDMFDWVVVASLLKYGESFLLDELDKFRNMYAEKFDILDLLDDLRRENGNPQ